MYSELILLNRRRVSVLFYGRQFELRELQKQYEDDKFSFPVIYGRRRVGKSELITKFIDNKKAIYCQAVIGTAQQNLQIIAQAVQQYRTGMLSEGVTYTSIEAALDDVTQLMKEEKIVFVIDEFPYLAESIPSAPSVLQWYIDTQWKYLHSMFILCGSSMSFIEKQILDYTSPLYGRNITRYKLLPFTFQETRNFLKNVTNEDALAYYAITSGIPYYLIEVNQKESLSENLRRLFLYKNSKLLEEPMNLLNMEVKDPTSYLAVLSAIAGGSSKHNEVVTKSGLSSPLTSKVLENLIDLGIVEKRLPMLSTSQKGIYRIKDNLYRFWFTFIFGKQSFIETGHINFIERMIEEQLNHFLGSIFEDICREWLLDQSEAEQLPTFITKIGSWWGGNPKTKEQEEMDVLATDYHADELFLGECKWQNEKVNVSVVKTLLERGTLFSHPKKYYYVFSKNGFDAKTLDYGKEHHIELITYAMMFSENSQ